MPPTDDLWGASRPVVIEPRMMQKTPSMVCTTHVAQRRPRMPPLRDDQSEMYPPSERAKRFIRP